MNKQSPGIGWCGFTWNPITGCMNGCEYCYARTVYERHGWSFAPAFHPERLKQPQGVAKPSRIFLGSVTDFGSKGVREEWIRKVADATALAPHHDYMILTKRPERLPSWLFGYPWWFGVSVTCQADLSRLDRLMRCSARVRNPHARFFVSFEPLRERVEFHPHDISPREWGRGMWHIGCCIQWVIVGGLTTNNRTVAVEKGGTDPCDVNALVNTAASYLLPVYVKNNAPVGSRFVKEFPK